ncbi:D-alanyl-lipoteichoic acid biosynthesis protein DltB [Lactobacillus bombicola]|uniref:Teichoic acid D-alanyltransferase n=1 Tax=Lactobacillus bombicola TaxID=1505723 RepID=A0ABX9LTK3_9LACO|nr:D-alanyl-lipoteichoic acid biosynthesis protein DltB [Lactobacillus bombicola]RHW50380.1 D-alanyl-lipoteichoic acid biosynthesis protein DltB [Lactobacillus bombicola]RHW52627.1 D-alanyl-lipoteichoic acid biosynthesis protein DltB [Lactobacillus bombicola]
MNFNFINLQPYTNPQYFVYLMIGLVPIIIGLYHGHRLKIYEVAFSLVFLFLIFDGDKWQQGVNLIIYLLFQLLVSYWYLHYRQNGKNKTWVFYLAVVLAILPLVLVKFQIAFPKAPIPGVLAFLGISYITFKTVQVIMETRDGAIKELDLSTYLRFLLFFPTFSSGPIDRYRRFAKECNVAPKRDQYLADLEIATRNLFQGFLYKFVLGWFFGTYWLPKISKAALIAGAANGGLKFSWWLVAYMYCYSMYLFFDFAGYSLFAVSISNFMGIHTPVNFNKPFISQNIKEFWNRWHMTLSFWFRDYIYMRFTFFAMKKKLFKNPIRLSQAAYLLLFLTMGFWHGLTWYYIVYGLFHAMAIIINDCWLRYKKRHKEQIPSNKFTKWLAIFVTFNIVCFSFLIFSGFLSELWFGWK